MVRATDTWLRPEHFQLSCVCSRRCLNEVPLCLLLCVLIPTFNLYDVRQTVFTSGSVWSLFFSLSANPYTNQHQMNDLRSQLSVFCFFQFCFRSFVNSYFCTMTSGSDYCRGRAKQSPVYAHKSSGQALARSRHNKEEKEKKKKFDEVNYLGHWYILGLGHTNNRTRFVWIICLSKLLRRRAVVVEDSQDSQFGKICNVIETLRVQFEGTVKVWHKVRDVFYEFTKF